MTLADLKVMLEQRAAIAEAENATAPVANVYRLVLGELGKLNGGNGGSARATSTEPDRMLTVPEVAQRLRVKTRFVYAHRKALGGVALSKRALRFPETAVDRYLARRP
jgi:excisionase family DNA binding protein